MGVESSTERQNGGERGSVQNAVGPDEEITSIDALTTEIDTLIDGASRLQRYEYVIGEVSDYGVSSNDHAFFDLVHNGSPLRCVIFQYRRQSIDIEDGMQLAVQGDVSFYTSSNYCSIKIEHVVAVGEGDYQQTYEENKQLLAEHGLLDDATKQPLPSHPECIGIATSAQRLPLTYILVISLQF